MPKQATWRVEELVISPDGEVPAEVGVLMEEEAITTQKLEKAVADQLPPGKYRIIDVKSVFNTVPPATSGNVVVKEKE